MKVFAVFASDNFCGGLAIVAANDKQEARRVASGADTYPWRLDYSTAERVDELPLVSESGPKIITTFEMGE